MKIFILGINSFIGKELYIKLRQTLEHKIYCLSHHELSNINGITNDDIIINCCGVNRGTDDEFLYGNYIFLQELVSALNNTTPYIIHLSSYMVNGFRDKKLEELSGYSKIFINSKLMGEEYLNSNYPANKLCIIRPSNIYGYSCEPYYNNILVTMIYETITNEYKTTSINKNCYRNFLSIDGLCNTIIGLVESKLIGTYNIVSNNTVSLKDLVDILNVDSNLNIMDGESSIPNNSSNGNIIVNENLNEKIISTKKRMKLFLEIKNKCRIKKLTRLSQSRGDMVEISNLESKRLYMITITQNSFRGNHYHYNQKEEFYIHRGSVIFLLAHRDDTSTVLMSTLRPKDHIVIEPYIIHTLVNDFTGNDSEVFVTSTQEYVPNCAIDTEYVSILK